MDSGKLWKATAALCIGFAAYCIAAAICLVAFELVEFSIIFALIFLAFGIFYLLAGISILRKGRFGWNALIGVFGIFFWWGTGIPWYVWPMMVMPIIISVMFVVLVLNGDSGSDGEYR